MPAQELHRAHPLLPVELQIRDEDRAVARAGDVAKDYADDGARVTAEPAEDRRAADDHRGNDIEVSLVF